MSIAPAPITTFKEPVDETDHSIQANQTGQNFNGIAGRVSPEPTFPPINGAVAPQPRNSGLTEKRADDLNDMEMGRIMKSEGPAPVEDSIIYQN